REARLPAPRPRSARRRPMGQRADDRARREGCHGRARARELAEDLRLDGDPHPRADRPGAAVPRGTPVREGVRAGGRAARAGHRDDQDRKSTRLNSSHQLTLSLHDALPIYPWANVRTIALVVKDVMDELGLASWPKTSGSTGIHILAPIVPELPFPEVRRFAKAFAQEVERRVPDIATTKIGRAHV